MGSSLTHLEIEITMIRKIKAASSFSFVARGICGVRVLEKVGDLGRDWVCSHSLCSHRPACLEAQTYHQHMMGGGGKSGILPTAVTPLWAPAVSGDSYLHAPVRGQDWWLYIRRSCKGCAQKANRTGCFQRALQGKWPSWNYHVLELLNFSPCSAYTVTWQLVMSFWLKEKSWRSVTLGWLETSCMIPTTSPRAAYVLLNLLSSVLMAMRSVSLKCWLAVVVTLIDCCDEHSWEQFFFSSLIHRTFLSLLESWKALGHT